jgi:2,6-dihydroxypyridine 3-monooxygenase
VQQKSKLRVSIVGGSLGGLTAALLLQDLGYEVTIFERSAAPLEQRGAGIGLLQETSRYLVERAGINLDAISVQTDQIRHLDRSGKVLHEDKHTYRFSSWNTIYRELLACFGRERYLLDHEVLSIEQQATDAAIVLRNGDRITSELVVCADGVGSKFRSSFLPNVTPRYSGYVAWRGMVPEGELPGLVVEQLGDAITYAVIANSHILAYPIPGLNGSVEPGHRLINYVWYRNYLPGSDLNDLMTDNRGERREVSLPPGAARAEHVAEMKAHAQARLPPSFATVVMATKEPFVQVVLDVEVDRMVFGRVCLVGDSAWVARPHAAAGTAKAADDAWALAESLTTNTTNEHVDVLGALAAWEKRQLQVGKQLVERTRRIGQESQFDMTWKAGDPSHIFGLHRPGS